MLSQSHGGSATSEAASASGNIRRVATAPDTHKYTAVAGVKASEVTISSEPIRALALGPRGLANFDGVRPIHPGRCQSKAHGDHNSTGRSCSRVAARRHSRAATKWPRAPLLLLDRVILQVPRKRLPHIDAQGFTIKWRRRFRLRTDFSQLLGRSRFGKKEAP